MRLFPFVFRATKKNKMKINDKICLKKLEAFNPVDVLALPVNYWIHGYLMNPIAVGTPIEVLRTVRNGVETNGIFLSSPISKIDGDKLHTSNSIWQIEVLESAKHSDNIKDVKF